MLCQKTWKDIILKGKGNAKILLIFDHHIVRNTQTHSLSKLTSKELHLILFETNTVKLEKPFFQFNWKKMYFLIR